MKKRLMLAVFVCGGFIVFMWALAGGTARADMCGPSGLPVLSSLNPYVKGCNVWVPFVPGVKVPVVMPPANAPYPVPGIGGAGGLLGPYAPGSGYSPLP